MSTFLRNNLTYANGCAVAYFLAYLVSGRIIILILCAIYVLLLCLKKIDTDDPINRQFFYISFVVTLAGAGSAREGIWWWLIPGLVILSILSLKRSHKP